MVDGGKLVRDNYPDDPEEITDHAGNAYPLDFLDVDLESIREQDGNIAENIIEASDVLNEHGYLSDYMGEYDPFGGNRVPLEEKCNAHMRLWESRYGEPRYCSQSVFRKPDDDKQKKVFFGGFCYTHQNRQNIMKTAEETLQTGFYAKTIDHLFENIDGWHLLLAHGLFEYLMGESAYTFAPEYEVREFDFSDSEMSPAFADGDTAEIKVAYPTDHPDRAVSLFQAAMDRVNMLTIKAEVSGGPKPLQSRTTEHAQLTAPPSEHDSSPQEFLTIEEWTEHHLNLPYDRLVRSQDDLLEYGGVGVEIEDENEGMDVDELVLDVSADLEDVETKDTVDSPHSFTEETPESERILEHATKDKQ